MPDHIASVVGLLTNRAYDVPLYESGKYVAPAWDMWYKMSLGALIKHRAWVEAALRDILELSAEEWRLSPHRVRIQPDVLCEIMALVKDIEKHRREGAYITPSLVTPSVCTTRVRCREGWDVLWADVLGGRMVHPIYPKSDTEVLRALKNANFNEVCAHCALATYEKLRTRAVYRLEEYFFERCVCNILGQSPPGK
jgi:hypothetical protein